MLLDFLKRLATGSEDRGSRDQSGEGSFAQAQQVFSKDLLADFFRLVHEGTTDNYDHHRFSYDGVDRSGQFNLGFHTAHLHWYFERANDFFLTYSLFKDAESRELFRRLLLYRLLGHLHVCIRKEDTWSTEKALMDKAGEYDAGPSSLEIKGMFGPIRHYDGVPVPNADSIKLDCWGGNVTATAFKRQYFFSRNGVAIAPERGDIVIDAGACLGDTAVYFAATVGEHGHVYAFDPLPSHNEVVAFNIRQNHFESRVTAVPLAVGDTVVIPSREPSNALIGGDALPGFSMVSGDFGLPVTTLDAFAAERSLSKIDFIKMDIEGFEMPALLGAKNIIKRFSPKLAISLYHKPFDLIDIPIWVAQNFPGYALYLDHYTIHNEETVLYAVPQ